MPRAIYEVRVVGEIGPAARSAFRDLAVEVDPATTVLTGEFDPEQLYLVLNAVRDLGLELVEVRHHHVLDQKRRREDSQADKGPSTSPEGRPIPEG